jgi:hypothetical protein
VYKIEGVVKKLKYMEYENLVYAKSDTQEQRIIKTTSTKINTNKGIKNNKDCMSLAWIYYLSSRLHAQNFHFYSTWSLYLNKLQNYLSTRECDKKQITIFTNS